MRIFARREIFKQTRRIELVRKFLSVAFKRKVVCPPFEVFGNFHAAQVCIVKFAPATILDDIPRQVHANKNRRIVRQRFKLPTHTVIKDFVTLFGAFNRGHVEASTVRVIVAAVLKKDAIHIEPKPISFERAQANRQGFACAGVGKKIFFAGGLADKFFGGAFHHFGEGLRTPHREIISVGVDAHKDGVCIGRVENFFAKVVP